MLLPSRLTGLIAAVLLVVAAAGASAGDAGKWVAVPPGNRSPTQPPISTSSIVRTQETQGTFADKYKAVYDALASDNVLIGKIKSAAAVYGIDPIHMIGAIVGEHTYNVDVFDNLQSYYVKALAYLHSSGLAFSYNGEPIDKFVARPQFAACATAESDYALWDCRARIWRDDFQGKTVGGESFPDDSFGHVFFQPFYVGQTFGLGQLNPLAALAVSDVVHQKSGLEPLDMRDAPAVYQAVMDPDMTLAYMAATIRAEIDTYRAIAGFDISGNPGLTATLYNTGEVIERAQTLADTNRKRRAQGLPAILPRENYYGWLINDRLAELKKLLSG